MLASDERVSQRHQPRADLKVHQQEQQVGQPAAEALEAAEAAEAAAAEARAAAEAAAARAAAAPNREYLANTDAMLAAITP